MHCFTLLYIRDLERFWYLQILVSAGGPGINPSWILRGNSSYFLGGVKNYMQPWPVCSVGRASTCGLKGSGFDSGQGHMPRLWLGPQ